MTLLDNRNKRRVDMRNMERMMNIVKKRYFNTPLLKTLPDDKKEISWQKVFNKKQIYEFLITFENANEYLILNATFHSIMAQYNYKWLKYITIMPNIDWYFYVDEKNHQKNDIIQCIIDNCPHKNKPICFMQWVPSNNPEIAKKYRDQGKEFYSDRAYIMALCDIHFHKAKKDHNYMLKYMVDFILPLRKYENDLGFVVLPDNVKRPEFIYTEKIKEEHENNIPNLIKNVVEKTIHSESPK